MKESGPHQSRWVTYFENTRDREPRPLLVEAMSYVARRGQALDLGAGALNDSRFLLNQGFGHVTAVDIEPVALEIAQALPDDRFGYEISSFEDLQLPADRYDLVSAQYSLPFSAPASFREVIKHIKSALSPGGVLTGQLFGDRDEWNTPRNDMTFVDEAEARTLLEGLEVLKFMEEEKDWETASGMPKHWHLFHFIARGGSRD